MAYNYSFDSSSQYDSIIIKYSHHMLSQEQKNIKCTHNTHVSMLYPAVYMYTCIVYSRGVQLGSAWEAEKPDVSFESRLFVTQTKA